MVSFAPQASDQYNLTRATPDGFLQGDFAIGGVLVGGMGLARHEGIIQQEFRAGGIKIANPELRHKPAGRWHVSCRYRRR